MEHDSKEKKSNDRNEKMMRSPSRRHRSPIHFESENSSNKDDKEIKINEESQGSSRRTRDKFVSERTKDDPVISLRPKSLPKVGILVK